MRLRFGYALLFLGLLALLGQTIVRLARERQFYELQLRQQAAAIEAGLREQWRLHLLTLARADHLPKDFRLRWDRSGRDLRSPFFPNQDVRLTWEHYRDHAKRGDKEAQEQFLNQAIARQGSWDRVLALEEWKRLKGRAPDVELSGYETTVLNPEARHAFQLIFEQFESAKDFTFARATAEFDRVFYQTTGNGELEGYLPSIESVQRIALASFLQENRLSKATFGATSLDIRFPDVAGSGLKQFNLMDALLLLASAASAVFGVWLMATGLKEQREQLLKRVSFLNQVVHELKTPLAGLKLSAQLIRRSGPSERNLLAIGESITRLDRLFDDIVQINRSESDVDLEAMSPEKLGDLLKEFALDARVTIESWPQRTVYTEPGRLRVLLRNLISNGIKYGDRVSVLVDENSSSTRIQVRDEGSGISKSDAGQIFDEFFRAEKARNTQVDGLGLGLSLVKKLSRELKGETRLVNPGEPGAIFEFTFPEKRP